MTSNDQGNTETRAYKTEHPDLLAALAKFERAALASITPFTEATAAVPTPSRVYHYTDDAGLRGILETGKLRLTDVFALNDPSEIHHGMAQSADILRSCVAKGDSKIARFFLERYEDFLRDGVRRSAYYNVCCFSKHRDSLSQWRAYADNGRGYALGFEARLLEHGYSHVGGERAKNRSIFHVAYNDKKLIELQTTLVNEMLALVELPKRLGVDSNIGMWFLVDLSAIASVHALHASLYFKHEAYRDEDEYRFLTVEAGGRPLEGAKTRMRRYELVRYTEFDWRTVNHSLKEIVVGPAALSSAEHFARDCLLQYHNEQVDIHRSQIPYRSPHL